MGVAWRWAGRRLAVDVPLAVVVGAMAIGGSTRLGHSAEYWDPLMAPLDAVAYVLLAVAVAALVVRRFWPLPVFAVTIAAMSAYLAGHYPYGPSLLPGIVAMYTVAAHRQVRRSLIACGLAVLAYLAGHTVAAVMGAGMSSVGVLSQWPMWAPWSAVWLALPWAVGTLVRMRREQVVRGRAENARRAADEERLRIVREVHDVVGHSLSVINMQSGIALHVFDKRPEQAQTALDAIKQTSKEALDELRGTLAVFRQPDGAEAQRRPTPGLDQLEELAASMSRSGLRVELDVTGEEPVRPAAVDLAAYRIIQESLTNVLRHAGTATATVRVGYRPGEVTVEVTDDGRGQYPSARTDGHGIAGMRERASALGGTLEAGPRPEGGFGVRASLPLEDSGQAGARARRNEPGEDRS